MLRTLMHQGLIKNHFPIPSRLMLSNRMTDVEAIRKYPNLLQHGLETGLIYRLIFSIFWSNLYLFLFAATIFRFCCSNSSAERNASNSSPEKACWAAWIQWMLKQILLKIKCFNNHIFRINLLLSCAGFFSKALPNNHEKMVIISMWCCEPLCTKGLKTRQNRLCENRQKKAIKSKKTRNLGLRLPISGPVFTKFVIIMWAHLTWSNIIPLLPAAASARQRYWGEAATGRSVFRRSPCNDQRNERRERLNVSNVRVLIIIYLSARVLLTFREPRMRAVHCRRRGHSFPGSRLFPI